MLQYVITNTNTNKNLKKKHYCEINTLFRSEFKIGILEGNLVLTINTIIIIIVLIFTAIISTNSD